MRRSLVFAAVGVFIGLMIGYFIGSARQDQTNSRGSGAVKSPAGTEVVASSRRGSSNLRDNIVLLGQIETVPFQELYGLLAQHSPAEIAEMAKQLNDLPPSKKTNAKIAAFFRAWAHLDPTGAFKAAADLKTAETREAAISATITGADESAAGSLAHSLNELSANVLPAMNKAGLLAMAISKWSEANAPGAAQFFDETSAKGLSFTLAAHGIAQNWATNDPQAAMAWARQHPSGPMGASALSGAISSWWQKDHAAAESYAASQINAPEAMQLVTGLISSMAEKDPKRAVAWLNQLPNEELRKQTEGMLAAMWAVRDPLAASEWAASLPNEQASNVLGSTMSFWAQSDPDAASRWVGTLTGTTRDNAIGAFSSGIVATDPATAMEWVGSIADPAIRDRALRRVVGGWMFRDPVGAKAWIQNSSLGEAEKARLLATPPGG